MDLTFFQNETYKRDGNSNRAQREAKITVFIHNSRFNFFPLVRFEIG